MKTAETKNASPHSSTHTEQPFFQKDGEHTFFSDKQTDIQTKPFFDRQPTVPSIQTKLSIGRPGDKYEQEADAMADRVVQRMNNPETVQTKPMPLASTVTPLVQPKCTACEEEEQLQKKDEEDQLEHKIQRKAVFESDEPPPEEDIQCKCAECLSAEASAKEGEAEEKVQKKDMHNSSETGSTSSLESRLNASRGSGRSLPEDTRTQMESSFGADFSNVRIHTGSSAVQMNQDIGAQAFTHGSDIYFNSGKYNTGSTEGKKLLAHELTHTVQQEGGRSKRVSTNQNKLSSIQVNPFIQREESTEEIEIPTFDTGEASDCPQLLPNEPLIPEVNGDKGSREEDSSDIFESLMQFAPGGLSLGGGILFGIGAKLVGKLGLSAWGKLPTSMKAFILNRALDTSIFVNKLLSKLLSKATFLTGAVLSWIQSGFLGFLERLRRAKDSIKVMMFEKFVRIITGNSAGFMWGYVKGLFQGFFVDGLLGIIQMIIDIVCLVKQFPKLLGALEKFFEVFPTEMARLAIAIVNLETAIAAAFQGAVDEVWTLIKDPARIIGFLNTVSEAIKGASKKMGEKLAEGFMRVASLPVGMLGKAAGRIGGMALFEIVLAVLTSGGGLAVTASKAAVKVGVKLMAMVGKHLLAILRFIGFILRHIAPYVTKVKRYLTPLFKTVAGRLSKVFGAIDDFIKAILKRCRPGSVICEVPGDEELPEGAHRAIGTREAITQGAHDIGVKYGRARAEALGLRDANWVNPFEFRRSRYGQGFDDLMQDSGGNLWIVEYKGGTASLAPGQMTRDWIVTRINRYRTQGGPLGQFWADRLETALNNGQLRGIAFSTPIKGTIPQTTTIIGYWSY